MSKRYAIRTATGYMGRMSMTGPMSADLPIGFAYVYDTADNALAAARLAGIDAVEAEPVAL